MLLFTRDEELAKLLGKISPREVIVFESIHDLRIRVDQERADAIVIDCDDHVDGWKALKASTQSPANGSTATIAITNSETAEADARDQGAWLVVEKSAVWKSPRQIEDWLASVRRREHQRHRTKHSAAIDSGEILRRQVQVVNISRGGACFAVEAAADLEKQLVLRIAGGAYPCEIVWRDARGQVGVKFLGGKFNDADLQKMICND